MLAGLSACQIGVRVGIDANADGTGAVRAVVTLDREAATRVPDLASELQVGDLTKAGWKVTGPSPSPSGDGGITIEALHTYRNPAEERQLVSQLSGPGGPFKDFRVARTHTFLRTTTRFSGTVDLSGGAAVFSDPQLAQRLGSPFGVDQAALEKQLGTTLARIFQVEVVARLPGATTSNAPGRAANGAVWRPKLGEQVRLRASSSHLNSINIALAVASALFGLAFVVVVLRRVLHRP